MDKLSLLKSVFIFKELNDDIMQQLLVNVEEVKLDALTQIFEEGSFSDSFYIIESGEVIIYKKLGADKEKVLIVLNRGNIFGETAFFSNQYRTANAKTKNKAVLLKIARKPFLDVINKNPKEGINILSRLLEVVTARLERTSRELATVYQTSKIIASARNLNLIVKGIREEILLAVPEAENVITYLYNEFNREFEEVAADKSFNEIPLQHPLIKQLKENPSGFIFNDSTETPLSSIDFLKTSKAFSIVPCILPDKLLGFMAITNTKKTGVFENHNASLLLAVSDQLAEAIENIHFQQEEQDRKRLMNARESFND
ncbi:MAG: cyclic nucleotide-binding domain-containing protein [Elusimicrobia bacterium]|nr:cyclic nucleotide-binding domain-containing protein [Candidatus Liberimonas magnetica]